MEPGGFATGVFPFILAFFCGVFAGSGDLYMRFGIGRVHLILNRTWRTDESLLAGHAWGKRSNCFAAVCGLTLGLCW